MSKPLITIALLVGLIAVTVSLASAQRLELLHRIALPDQQPGSKFGDAIALGDGLLAVGEPSWSDFEAGIGFVGRTHIFNAITGELVETLTNPDPDQFNGGGFGTGLAIGDGKLFAGAPAAVVSRVHAYDLISRQFVWSREEDDSSETDSATRLGSGLTFDEGQLLAVAPGAGKGSLFSSGRGFVFDPRDGSTIATLANPEPASGDVLGTSGSHALSDGKAIIGSPFDCRNGDVSIGCVWVYDAETAEVLYRIDNPTPKPLLTPNDAFDRFGRPIAADAGYLVVGDQFDEPPTGNSSPLFGVGGAYVFDLETGDLLHELRSPYLQEQEFFGGAVAVTPWGDILVGAWGSLFEDSQLSGRVFLFDGETGELVQELPGTDTSRLFGRQLAVDSSLVAITASAEGAVYLYAVVPEPSSATYVIAYGLACLFYPVRRRMIIHG